MIEHTVSNRVRYAETDQMGYVYYGNYATYFEVARVETFRNIGFSYKELEDSGILMPVVLLNTKYIKPLFYDEEFSVKVKIVKKPTVKIVFEYEVYNQKNELTTTGETVLVFVNKETGKPCMAGEYFEKLMDKHLE